MAEENTQTEPKNAPEIPEAIIPLINALTERLDRDKVKQAYANNARIETSVWDLKILFGQLDQRSGKWEVDWHTLVTMPWVQAKILDYFLRLNLAYYDHTNGPMMIPDSVKPRALELPENADPRTVQLFQTYNKIHKDMFG